MRRIILGILAPAVLLAGPSWAQDTQTTTAESGDVTRGYLQDEVFSIKPMVGVIHFEDRTAVDESGDRFAAGLSMDYNITNMVTKDLKELYVGPQIGLIYSHLGEPASNFFGSPPETTGSAGLGGAGANLLIIPTNLKIGWNVAPALRISGHGGGNVIYRSVASSMALDVGEDGNRSDSLWKYYPNAGAELEVGFGKSIALTLRPDWTFAPDDTFFVGTVGLGVSLG